MESEGEEVSYSVRTEKHEREPFKYFSCERFPRLLDYSLFGVTSK